jgi:hypothetical protein
MFDLGIIIGWIKALIELRRCKSSILTIGSGKSVDLG